LRYYYAAALQFPAMQQFTFEEFIARINEIHPKFVFNFGKDLLGVKISENAIRTNMESFARANEGRPTATARDVIDFYEPVKDTFDVSNVRTWLRLTTEGVSQAATEIKDAAIFGGSIALVAALVGVVVFGMMYLPRPK